MTRRLNDPAVQAEVCADYHGLPWLRITSHHGEAHVFTDGLDDFQQWLLALGGTLYRETAGSHTAVWTLHTATSHDRGAQVVVHTVALDTDQIDPAYAHLVHDATPHPPAA